MGSTTEIENLRPKSPRLAAQIHQEQIPLLELPKPRIQDEFL